MYVSVGQKTTLYLATPAKVYFHFPSILLCGSHPVSYHVTWYWKNPRTRLIQEVTTHISATKSNTNWMMDLKKNMDTRSLALSMLRILNILFQTAQAFVRFRITSGQSSSDADSNLPRYLKYRTIFRG